MALHAFGQCNQAVIAGEVTVVIVVELEVIDIEHQCRYLLAGILRPVHGLFESLIEKAAVGKPGQRVMLGQVKQQGGLPLLVVQEIAKLLGQGADLVAPLQQRRRHGGRRRIQVQALGVARELADGCQYDALEQPQHHQQGQTSTPLVQ
ncbi:hypothetical protein Q427_22710 [Halomonas sp. BC04]|nr:hypothetical protein [Halomonas sp. BC04]EWG99840.1 hypothetical protein Q427_22710 [Halomonas sp. BC04]